VSLIINDVLINLKGIIMAKEPQKNLDPKENSATASESLQASLNTLVQYVKDFSFENPRAPLSLQTQKQQPEISIGVNVNAAPMGENQYEVALKIEANAKVADGVLFNIELLYAGVFRITGVPEENIHPIVLIECPRLLFPFARQIVAEGTRNGGFSPLMIDPVDFASLYRQRVVEAQEKKAKEKSEQAESTPEKTN